MSYLGMATNTTRTLHVGPQGRVVIPVELRRELHIESGDQLVARVEDDQLIFEKPESILRRIRASLAGLSQDIVLSEVLIQERRAEAKREARELEHG